MTTVQDIFNQVQTLNNEELKQLQAMITSLDSKRNIGPCSKVLQWSKKTHSTFCFKRLQRCDVNKIFVMLSIFDSVTKQPLIFIGESSQFTLVNGQLRNITKLEKEANKHAAEQACAKLGL